MCLVPDYKLLSACSARCPLADAQLIDGLRELTRLVHNLDGFHFPSTLKVAAETVRLGDAFDQTSLRRGLEFQPERELQLPSRVSREGLPERRIELHARRRVSRRRVDGIELRVIEGVIRFKAEG